MSKAYVQDSDVLTVTAPYNVNSGVGCLVGKTFGVTQTSAASGAQVAVVTEGVHTLAKLSAQAWTEGADVYWDDTNKRCTTATTGNLKIGRAYRAAANPSATGQVVLNGFAL